MKKVDDHRLYTDRELNIYLQGQLSILGSLSKSIKNSGPWMLRIFTLPVIVETRQLILNKYREHFPESDIQ